MAVGSSQNVQCQNGTTVGSVQHFEVFCSSTAKGRRTEAVDANTLDECADACARANPRCTAATFNGDSCAFHNETDSPFTSPDPSPSFTAVVAIPTGSTSNCRTVLQSTSLQTVDSVQFTLSCGTDMPGESLFNHFASSLQDCMSQCAQTSLCQAVGFNADQTLGFQNCFLKKSVEKSNSTVNPDLDTAVVVGPAGAARPKPSGTSGGRGGMSSNNNVLAIVAAVASSVAFLAVMAVVAWWIYRKRKLQKTMSSLPEGVVPVSYKDVREEKRAVSVAWSQISREGEGEGEGVGRPTPVYEIRRKGESLYAGPSS